MTTYWNSIDNAGTGSIETKELIGGAKIAQIFEEKFSFELDKVDSLEDLTDEEIKIAICNSTGISKPLGVPQRALEQLVKKQLTKLVVPSLK